MSEVSHESLEACAASGRAGLWAGPWRLFDGQKIHQWKINDVSFDEAFRNALRGSALILSGNGEPYSRPSP